MNLLALLLALGAERLLPAGNAFGEPRLLRLLLRLMGRLPASLAAPAAATLPWLITLLLAGSAAAVQVRLAGGVWGALFGGVVLFGCLGPRDLADDVHRLIAARQAGDAEAARRIAQRLQQGPQPDQGHQGLLGALFIQSHERLFGVLGWFMLLGPAGAIAYRVASRLPQVLEDIGAHPASLATAAQLHGALAWLPARLTAGLFALAGSMDEALAAWRRVGELHFASAWRSHTWAVLAEVSAAALDTETADGQPEISADLNALLAEVLRMQTRALLILLGLYSLMTVSALA
jgi:membrane protein required for beta-lactamase induction